MKIWFMAQGFSLPAGIEAHIHHYAQEFFRRGWAVQTVVVCTLPEQSHRFLSSLRATGIPVEALEDVVRSRLRIKELGRFIWYFFCRLMLGHGDAWRMAKARLRNEAVESILREKIKEEDPDIIHIFGRLYGDFWAALPADKVIYHEMMTGTNDGTWGSEELIAFQDFAEKCVRVFAPGEGVAANLRRDFGITREIVPIFTMCPEEANFATDMETTTFVSRDNAGDNKSLSQKRNLRFGVICRFVEQKGIQYLLEALKLFRDRHGAVGFTFGGQGPLEDMIREFAAANHLPDFDIRQVVKPEDILKEIDVFVHPSLDDAMPVAIAEALMCGVPVIASKVGGIPDLVRDGVEGVLIEPRNVNQIVDAMDYFAKLPEPQMAEFRQRARARYEEVCTPEKVGNVVEKIYREIVKV